MLGPKGCPFTGRMIADEPPRQLGNVAGKMAL